MGQVGSKRFSLPAFTVRCFKTGVRFNDLGSFVLPVLILILILILIVILSGGRLRLGLRLGLGLGSQWRRAN